MKARIREQEYEMSYEYYKDHCIRYVKINDKWWAVLKDVCDVMNIRVDNVSNNIPAEYMIPNVPIKNKVNYDHDHYNSGVVVRKPRSSRGIIEKTSYMIVVNTKGILFAFGRSRNVEARQFQMWNLDVLDKLREKMGISERETFRMLDKEVQDEISYWLDDLYWDDERKCVMQSVTVQGGDVEQVPFI